MTTSFIKRIVPIASQAALISVFALVVSSCGGSGSSGGTDDSPATVRPKSLDGVRLTLDNNVIFEFVRNAGTEGAVLNGETEVGTFFYRLGGVQLRQYPNINGEASDCRWPDSISTAVYTYRAVNESAAVLTLTGLGVNDLTTTGSFNANNGSFVYFFNSDSNGFLSNEVVIDLTFSGNGTSITANNATVRIPGGHPLYDTVVIPASVGLVLGGPVPQNYNPVIDPDRPSKITPASLDNLYVLFTNGIPNPAVDFTVQFVAEGGNLPPSNNGPDEVGQGLLRVSGAVVDNAVDYTWERIGGTDDGVLVISEANNTFDGRYTLRFLGVDNGVYTGEVDAGTPDAAEVSGTFFLPDSP